MSKLTADQIVSQLQLEPHPEGGYFRETFRDPHNVTGTTRAASTAIYYLLKAGEVSRWHTVDAVETWHHYVGAALELAIAPPTGSARHVILGSNLQNGEQPQVVVPRGHWQQARALGEYTLVGCTVAPGFEFSGFVLAPQGFEPGAA